ncbi:MAG: hypothetical protein LBK03_00135 [Bacteroidales bacterium]|nr:hypothetical protein [Bacteroidales bacterium]
MRRFSLVIFLISVSFFVSAQKFSGFSGDVAKTADEVKAFIETAPKDRQREGDELVKQFELLWNKGAVAAPVQHDFIETANQLIDKKLRPFPHFRAFMLAYLAFAQSEHIDIHADWKSCVSYFINSEPGKFSDYMNTYADFFRGKYLNNKSNVKWRVDGSLDRMGIDKEPYLSFKNVDLTGASLQDSLTIINTSGRFFPLSGNWEGKGGEVNWARAGLTDQVKATLDNYRVEVKFAFFKAENVTFYYPKLFARPLKGRLEEKAGLEVSEEKATYPRFKSYENTLTVKGMYENVDYIGGFEMRGGSVLGSSDSIIPAKVLVRNAKGKLVVKVESYSFLFRPQNLLSQDARISVYFDTDSIYHPAANFKYNSDMRELIVSRPKDGVGRSPFFDSYHKMDIYAESIQWKTDMERIEIKPLVGMQSSSPARFESQNYFNSQVMREMQGFNEINPLYTLWEVFHRNKLNPLTLNQVCSHFKKSPVDIRRLLIDMAAFGFIEYDVINDRIIYRRKLAQYLNNDIDKMDYDNIVLESNTHFATIDLVTNRLNITGCEFFVLSDAQIVNVYPTGGKVTVKRNRDMDFSGKIIAGLFDFASHQCEFNYDKFEVGMNVIDTLILYSEDMNAPVNMYGEHKLRRIRSVIEELSGTLYIDVPGNKSGRVDYPDYPMFEARKGGHVFYDKQEVLGGVYTRDRFHFSLDRFIIKNLDNFSIDSMKFSGRLISGGIFEDIEEPLQIRPDFSLGFVYKTNPSGIKMYEGRATYHNVIDLSNRGLRGKGTIQYLTSTTIADDYIFYLDSTTGNPSSHVVAPQIAGTEYPPASVVNARLFWQPYQEQMFVYTKNSLMDIFGETRLSGFSRLTPSGMYGGGVLDFKRADLISQHFTFLHHALLADSSNLRIFMTEEKKEQVFSTSNYLSDINFQTRKGAFTSRDGFSEVFFIKNEYKARADYFEWSPIDDNLLSFKWNDPYAGVDINGQPARDLMDMASSGNELTATRPECRGLTFNAATADFDFGTNIIKCTGVRYIDVGDAAVIPDNGLITIREHADMDLLTGARIVAGRLGKFHELYRCTIKITAKNNMRGSGSYDYVDETDRVQTVAMDSIWFYQQTRAVGKISPESDFKLSPHFGFDGRVELNSLNEFLYFVGGVEIMHDCDNVKYARLRILQQVNPKAIYLEIHNRSKDVADRKAVVAIASANRTGRIYTCFGAAKDQFNDAEYISTFGYITYDHASNEFRAASMAKLEDPSQPGNIIRLNKYDCIATGTGAIDMGTKLGRVDFKTSGTITNYMKSDSADMRLSASIDFFFCEPAMKVMTDDIENSGSIDFFDPSSDDDYEQALFNMLGEKAYEKYKSELANTGRVKKIPDALKIKFLFSNVKFRWDEANSAFISQAQLYLAVCNSKEVDRVMPGRLVIEKKGSRNRFYFYTEFDSHFYFFQFENNSMYGFSSSTAFNEAIQAVSPSKRALNSARGLPAYSYKLGNRSQKNKFVKKYYSLPKAEEGSGE